MRSNAQLRIFAGVTPVHDHGLPQLDLVYIRPLGDFREYEQRLAGVARRFGERIRLTIARAGELSRFTRTRVFLSKAVPTIVLVRGGEVVAQAVGDLPARELEWIMRDATASRSAPIGVDDCSAKEARHAHRS
jgi:hypothetical protein